MHYAADVGNCFSSLPIENTPVMVFNVDRTPAVTVTVLFMGQLQRVPFLVWLESDEVPTHMDSDVPVNGAAVELKLSLGE